MTFPLQIVTPDGEKFHDEVEFIRLRTVAGDLGVRARHADMVTAIGMGECIIETADAKRRHAACIGGVLAMMKGELRIAATTFEWQDEIDVERCQRNIADAQREPSERNEARAQRAQVRLSVAQRKD